MDRPRRGLLDAMPPDQLAALRLGVERREGRVAVADDPVALDARADRHRRRWLALRALADARLESLRRADAAAYVRELERATARLCGSYDEHLYRASGFGALWVGTHPGHADARWWLLLRPPERHRLLVLHLAARGLDINPRGRIVAATK